MRILFVTSFFPPMHTAGTENYTYGIARALVEAGHRVQVLCAGEWDTGERYWNGHSDGIHNGVPVRRLNLNWTKAPEPNRYLYDNPLVSAHLASYLNEIEPDAVHITSCITMSAGIIRTIKEARLPLVVTLTDFWFLCPRVNLLRYDSGLCDGRTTAAECLRCMLGDAKIHRVSSRGLPRPMLDLLLATVSRCPRLSRLRGLRGMAMDMAHRKAFVRETLSLADEVIAPSACLRDIFQQCAFDVPMRLSPYGHDLSWVRSHNAKKLSRSIRIGYLGQVIPIKGVHLLTEAFGRATARGANATLSIFGDLGKSPLYTQGLRNMASDHDHIRFEGGFEHERLGDVLAEVDVVVVPSLWYENNPLVIQEAFATKTPVIATNLGGMSEFVQHDVNGLLFERGSVDDLAQQLSRVISQPGLLDRLRHGIPPVRTIAQEVGELTDIYSGLAADRG